MMQALPSALRGSSGPGRGVGGERRRAGGAALRAGLAAACLAGAARAAGPGIGCTVFLDRYEFEQSSLALGLALMGIEDFEESNLPLFGKLDLPAPLQGGVPNINGNGMGFPSGLARTGIIIQDNVFGGPDPPAPEPSGLPGVLYLVGPGFIDCDSEEVGEDLFLQGIDAGLDLIFIEPGPTGVGFELSRFNGFPSGPWHVTVYDGNDEPICTIEVPPPAAPEPVKAFVGVRTAPAIGRINIFDMAGPAPDAIDNIQLWRPKVPAPGCAWDCALPQDGAVNVVDFLAMLSRWGLTGPCDFDGDGTDPEDFLELLAQWGPCPMAAHDECPGLGITAAEPVGSIEVHSEMDGTAASPFLYQCMPAADPGHADIWYCLTYQPDRNLETLVKVSTTAPLQIEVSSGCACPPGAPVACGFGPAATPQFPMQPGDSVLIRLVNAKDLPGDLLEGLLIVDLVPVAPNELYIDPATGDDSFPGTALLPKATLAEATSFLAANPVNSTVYLTGTFHGQSIEVGAALSRCTIARWPGRPRPMIRADRITTGWALDAPTGEWRVDVGKDVMTSVVEDWDVRVKADGRHYGHLRGGVYGALAAGEWAQHDSTLSIKCSTGDPADHVIGVIPRLPASGIQLSGIRCTVAEVDTALYCARHPIPAPGETLGDNIVFQNADDCTIIGCDSWDGGIHCFGFLNNSNRCHVQGCRMYGSRSPFGASILDMESTLSQLQGDVSACYFACSGLLDTGGAALSSLPDEGSSIAGFFAQVDGPNQIVDIAVRDCTFEAFSDSPFSYAVAIGTGSTVPADDKDPEQYPVRFYDCAFLNHNRILMLGQDSLPGAHVAFIRCRMDATRYAEAAPSGFASILEFRGSSTPCGLMLDACTLVYLENEGGSAVWATSDGSRIRLRDCLLWEDTAAPAGAAHRWFSIAQPDADVWARGCVFGYRAPFYQHKLFHYDSATAVAAHDLRDCWYFNVNPGGYSQNAMIDTQAEWTALVDPDGVYELDPELAGPPEDMEGIAGGNIRTLVNGLDQHAIAGINRLPWDGHYGAYQYGGWGSAAGAGANVRTAPGPRGPDDG